MTRRCLICHLSDSKPGQVRELPEGSGFVHDECWEFFRGTRPVPLRGRENDG